MLLGSEPLSQNHFSMFEGGLGLISSAAIRGAAYVGCQALVLSKVAKASAREDMTALFRRLLDRPMTAGLVTDL